MKVLVAVSDRYFADAIARFAEAHNWSENTEFKLISVVTPLKSQPGKSDEAKRLLFESESLEADKLLSKVKTRLLKERPDLYITYEVLIGSPGKEILSCARDWSASMILMGTHGRRGLERAFLGSVSFFVASHAPCSFTFVRLTESDALDFDLEEEDIPEEMRSFV